MSLLELETHHQSRNIISIGSEFYKYVSTIDTDAVSILEPSATAY